MNWSAFFQRLLPLFFLLSPVLSYNLDGFSHDGENELEMIKLSAEKEILIGNNRVWFGADATHFVKSICLVMLRDHSPLPYAYETEVYWSWKYYLPAGIVGPQYVVTEQAGLINYKNETDGTDVVASDLAVVCYQREGAFTLTLVEEILLTQPRYDFSKDENDFAMLKLKTPIDFGCNSNLAPTIVSCDRRDIFSGASKKNSPEVHEKDASGTLDENSSENVKVGWGWGWGSAPHPPEPMQCIYVSWGLTQSNSSYHDAPSNIYPTYTNVDIYNLNECRQKYTDVGYYIDPYNKLKYCTVATNDRKGPDCDFDYNGLSYCYFGHGDSKRRLLVGLMTNIQDLCETQYPNVILRYAFYAELFLRAGFECCDPQSPTGCNCQKEYQNLPNIGPYFCPVNN